MPFFRPASRALSHLLRHDPSCHLSSPASLFSRHSPLAPFTRAFDHPFFSAPLYTVYEVREDDNSNDTHSNHTKAEQHKPEEAKAAEPQQQQQQQRGHQQSHDGRLAHRHEDNHRQRWLSRRDNRRHRHHHGHHHPLSLFSPFDSLLASPFLAQSSFRPLEISVDMYSTPSAYQVNAAIPGVKKKDIKLTVNDGVLTIEAERREERGRPSRSHSAASTTPASTAASSTSTSTSASPAEAAQAKQKPVELEVKADGVDTKPAAETQAQEPQQQQQQQQQHEAEEEDDDVHVHHVESHYGRVQRSLALPEDVDVDGLTARYEDGVLKIELPRVEERKQEVKQINIQ